MHSVFYFNSTLSNNNIATLAAVASDLYIQPECQCPPSHSIVLERECQDLSGTNRISRINSAAHDATYINDGNTSTWWQSSNGETPVNVTVGLGGLRAALTVVMHFKSHLPRAMVLYYSTNGELFSPRQFYAVNCSMLSFLSNGSLSTSTDVSCVTFNSSSLRDWYVEFTVCARSVLFTDTRSPIAHCCMTITHTCMTIHNHFTNCKVLICQFIRVPS